MSKTEKTLKVYASSRIDDAFSPYNVSYKSSEINHEEYLDFVEELLTGINWKESSWSERIGVIINLAQITYDFYKQYSNIPTNEEKIAVLVDTAMIGWDYAKKAFNIKLPFGFSMIEKWLIKTIVEGAFRFIVLKNSDTVDKS